MPKRYFDLLDDVYLSGRWQLGHPLNQQGEKLENPWQFRIGEPAREQERVRIPIKVPGKPLGFSHAAFSIPIVDAKVASVFAELAPGDVQLVPVDVEGQPEGYFILNVTHVVKCIDDQACEEVEYWTEEDGRPEKVGQYRNVAGMRIEPTKVGDAQVFRPWGWLVALVVSEDIKTALERIGATGTRFVEVTGPGTSEKGERQLMERHAALRRQVDAAREAAYRSLGELEEAALVPIAMGDPPWPGQRQAWRIIRRPGGRTLLATDGLSDPFLDREEPSAGLGLELVIETDESVKSPAGSWPMRLLQRVTDEVVVHERVRTWLLKGLASMEVSGEDMPPALVTEEGRVAVLLGVESRTVPRGFLTPAGEVRLVTVKALLPVELEYMLSQGRAGPGELARKFARSGEEHLSRADRAPVA